MSDYTVFLPEKGKWKAHRFKSVKAARKSLINKLEIEKAEIVYLNGTEYGSVKYTKYGDKKIYIFRRNGNKYVMNPDGSLGRQILSPGVPRRKSPEMERFRQRFNYFYDRLYEGKIPYSDKWIDYGDNLIQKHDPMVTAFSKYRRDYLTSDREVQAFAMAYDEMKKRK